MRSATASALPQLAPMVGRPFGIYVHVPFCTTRCGYCDFNTYTADQLGGASPQGWLEGLRAELAMAAGSLDGVDPVRVDTVFVGGGTPSLLGGSGLAAVLDAVRAYFALAPDAEITTEANPESTSPAFFEALGEAGYTRVSLGMQSAAPHVLATLDRVHAPGRAVAAAREARAAGFVHVNLDLIYGTPGETDDDLRLSVEKVLEAGVDHVSAYALIVEEGTALARRVRRGELPGPDEDTLADRYQLLDAALSHAGMRWYEVSNWAGPAGECRHNMGYWTGADWWGAGPGAHSHVNGVRWWNVKHPNTYVTELSGGQLPVAGYEVLDSQERHTEDVLLSVRLASGVALADLTDAERDRALSVVADGLGRFTGDRLTLTDRGRLLADGVVRTILG